MKKLIPLLLVIFIGTSLIAGTEPVLASKKIVSGKVIDKTSGEEIAGAEVLIGNKTIYTDLNGNFSASIDLIKTKATVKYISYNETNVTIDPLSYQTLVIELSSK
jgi:hypothetical protein